MKTLYLFLWTTVVGLSISLSAQAQCTILDPIVELIGFSGSEENCTANVTISFTIDKNNGNKYTYIHLWNEADYPDPAYDYKKAPEGEDLASALATIAISTNGSSSLLSTYGPDETVTPLFAGLFIAEEDLGGKQTRITISNVQIVIPGACENPPKLISDIWSTQAEADKHPPVHCVFTNIPLTIKGPEITGEINCNEPEGPRTYDLNITTTDPNAIQVTYKLYLDDGALTNNQPTFGPDDELFLTSSITLSSTLPITKTEATYPYDFMEDKRSIWVVLTLPSLPHDIIYEIVNNCSLTLPVKLAKFKGDLLDNAIALSWITTEESGSSYFDVERSKDAVEFVNLGRIQATGTTDVTQHYSFLDQLPLQGNNYYRLTMVDLDGSTARSSIIAVANHASSISFELLGNPVTNREVRFILKNEKPENIMLHDLNGRSIDFSISKTGNTYTLKPGHSITSGLYLLNLRNYPGQIKKVLIP
ncbi:T9SS type A sorting domain-containing protein [Dyadobacter sp. CY351]|uniref:T9SS type A sorting domain-containing protein n=1 Tax=Dyadobacter sp. CY351 TaxID=2909337 RepID=UPI001F2E07E0|nr:T9SS type A sorting domain-containing protein [Dyadobacter sp. CY351]MCF2520610.1 T9SS type A sorting domain-containing protein [Dyadobacter sp. CY351]